MNQISFDDFNKVDIRVGKIVHVEDFEQARKPAYKLAIDFGSELGVKKSSAQLTKLYDKTSLVGKLILAVVNFPTKQIANFVSEVLVLGVPCADNSEVVLIQPDKEVPLGGRLF